MQKKSFNDLSISKHLTFFLLFKFGKFKVYSQNIVKLKEIEKDFLMLILRICSDCQVKRLIKIPAK